jgi:ligand-binding SRPBCC domain-containing protein
VGIYGNAGDVDLKENSPHGSDFLAELCKSWEAEANAATKFGLRVVILRTGVVLSSEGGALEKMQPVKLGSGKQWVSWIHLDDAVSFIQFALDKPLHGPFNLVAPEPVTQSTFTSLLGSARGIPAFLRVPGMFLQVLLGEMSQIILDSQRAPPRNAMDAGFKFRFPNLVSAFENIFSGKSLLDQVFTAEQFVALPREKVVPFFSCAENLETLTPPWLNFRILKKSTPELRQGSEIEYKLRIHGVPVKWKTLISEWNLPESFADDQLKGPYRKWHHVHGFYPVPGGTLLTDRVTYQVPFSLLGKLLLSRWILRDIRTIFSFRKKKIRELL